MIRLLWKCSCMTAEAALEVPARDEKEGVVEWMTAVVQTELGLAHRALSPMCRATEMEYVKIPDPPGSRFIGDAP